MCATSNGGAQSNWGTPMRRSDAFVFSSILGAVACATQVPIDVNVLLATSDAGFDDGGFGFAGLPNGNAGFSSEFGGYPNATGGTPFAPTLPTGGAPALG